MESVQSGAVREVGGIVIERYRGRLSAATPFYGCGRILRMGIFTMDADWFLSFVGEAEIVGGPALGLVFCKIVFTLAET